ncbi:HNH endonuclease signature motif containing protein [Microbacterium sp. UFMG61]|uniref:HNH endonuclease signature motif containing protein n=1 Tax=Microbacterium sp. UFMG61 TaxID=2745935 RepID=UPI00188F0267|nr:HNH endonuclease signature motif containing protein [Microbacterium sp. UFMG61]
MASGTLALIDQVVSDLDRVLGDGALAALPDAERIEVLQAAGAAFRRIEATVVETIATGDAVDFPHSTGCRTQNELLQRTLLTDLRGATRVAKVVALVRREVSLASGDRLPARWPALREAMLDGAIGVAGMLAATEPIEKVSHRISVDDRLRADRCLARAARGFRPDPDGGPDAEVQGPAPTLDELTLLAETLVALLDPDGDEPGDEPARRRGITLGRVRDGLRSIKGYLTPEVAAQLELILDAFNNPKGDGPPTPGVAFTPGDDDEADEDAEDDTERADGDTEGAGGQPADEDPYNSDPRCVIDGRTAAQKRHDALAAALAIAARHRDMPTIGGAGPVLVVTVDAKDLANGTGRASVSGAWGQLPLGVAAHVGCTGTIQRVLFDEGRIIGITTTDRVFTVHQRRAIIARDRECLIPGCHVPASWCEIHHVTEHSQGGPTHTDNGVPLCWWHHRSLGTSGWEIRMDDGVPQVRGPGWWDPEQRWRTPRLSLPTREKARGAPATPAQRVA